ncbi:AraC family transcriptional regulator [Paenibacillus sp. Soil787]|uniref:AraC family transcriptional regulator n=1 Tax=Paenibacillus sp. Soil787 TaxID=1736411 RepID=UPI0006FAEF43|nr:helix-turn-helix domain-containing protein [Paenibacillus sp. Soil787]KRF43831.1 hypothetical protein ASG93_02635 [Paenibacillus sp. Soil787]
MSISSSVYIEGMRRLNLNTPILIGKDATFRVHYWGGVQDHIDTPIHQHSIFEICYVLDGVGIYSELGIEYPLLKHTLFISRPNIKHQISNGQSLFLIFVSFELFEEESSAAAIELFRQMAATTKIIISDAADTTTIRIWEALLLQTQENQKLFQDSIQALSIALLTSFTNVFIEQSDKAGLRKKRNMNNSSEASINHAILYIQDNLASRFLTQAAVADYLHISGRQLARIFQNNLGQTFKEYVRNERIRKAALMLSTTRNTIKQISEETGFDNVHYFTTVFSEVMGVSPGKFVDTT